MIDLSDPVTRAALWAGCKIVEENPDYSPVDDMNESVVERAGEIRQWLERTMDWTEDKVWK